MLPGGSGKIILKESLLDQKFVRKYKIDYSNKDLNTVTQERRQPTPKSKKRTFHKKGSFSLHMSKEPKLID